MILLTYSSAPTAEGARKKFSIFDEKDKHFG